MKKINLLLLIASLFAACSNASQQTKSERKVVDVPVFSADSAYLYVKKQVDFGPRIPNSTAHDQCAAYLSSELKRFGAEVTEQKADLTGFDGVVLKSVNVIGSFNPSASTRVMLCSHWDSRPWADNDPDPGNHKKPVMGANDGASGVGVLLEMARLMGKHNPTVGVDLIFLDAEDYGTSSNEESWCLGTQYWAKNPHVTGYSARYAILLDMVGAPNARFCREQASEYFAQSVVGTVWSRAGELGFGKYFINKTGGSVTDDHIYINRLAGIPTIDIIDFDPDNGGFGAYWHTIHDTMENVDRNTLNAVGTTLMHVVYNEK